MSDEEVKEPSPDFPESRLEETHPVSVEVGAPVLFLPHNPLSGLVDLKGLYEFEAWPSHEVTVSSVPLADTESHFEDNGDGILDGVEEVEMVEEDETEAEAEAEARPQAKAKAKTKTSAEASPRNVTITYTDTDSNSDTDSETGTDSDSESDSETEPEGESEGEVEEIMQSSSCAGAGAGAVAVAAAAAATAAAAASAVVDMQLDPVEAQPWPEEVIYGLLHMYKTSRIEAVKERVMMYNYMLGILNIPASVTPPKLRDFLAPFQESINEVKIIKDATPSRYMALIKFNTKDVADTFYSVYNGCSFNQKNSEICKLVHVGRIEVVKPGDGSHFPMKSLIELPRCAVCLERTGDSMKGILTWFCDQSFEGGSHQSQDDITCPVCSYCHMPWREQPRCLECGIRESLHICLICGLVGCGQSLRGHASKHFEETQHAYGMQLNNYKVWDYAENNYVQTGLRHLSTNTGQSGKPANEKTDNTQLEYSYLLSNQLESQKIFWEKKIQHLKKETDEEISNMKLTLNSTNEKYNKMELKVKALLKEKQAMDKKCIHLRTKVARLCTELQQEQETNKRLRTNQILLQKQLKEEKEQREACVKKETQINEIQEQLRGVLFYLEAQQKMNALPNSPPLPPPAVVNAETNQTNQIVQEEQKTTAMTDPGNTATATEGDMCLEGKKNL